MTWRLLSTPPLSGAANMAIDLWLMERARDTGESVFRVYGWSAPTLSLGRNQRALGGYDPSALARRGIDVVRRPTGGRAIVHWREITYSVTAPVDGLEDLVTAYRRINALLCSSLRDVGADVRAQPDTGHAPQPGMRPCFADPSSGELVATHRGRSGKVAGSAQLRENGVLLQHGSILLHDDQQLLVELSSVSVESPRALPLSELLEREVTRPEVERALFAGVRACLDPEASDLEFVSIESAALAAESGFRDPLWTWRR